MKKYLVMTIGNNPLPNYVVGKYMKDYEDFDNLILIHSVKTDKQRGTEQYANTLKDVLKYDDTLFVPITDVGSAIEIRTALENKLTAVNGQFHFNYTGGTKSMVIHTYEFLKKKDPFKFEGSYLDARNFKIIYDRGPIKPKKGDLRDAVKTDIKTLLKIHQYELISIDDWHEENDQYCPVIFDLYSSTMNKLKEKIKNGTHENERLGDVLRSIDPCFYKIARNFQWIKDNENVTIDKLRHKNKNLYDLINNKLSKGVFFEWQIFLAIAKCFESHGLKHKEHFGHSLKAINKLGRNIEIDIFVINGYVFNGISITTSDTFNTCKDKIFELSYRVQQIAGSESNSIFVGPLPQKNVSTLENSLLKSRISSTKFKIFGMEDLKNIGKKICSIVFK